MAYQITLSLNGNLISDQFESFSFTEAVDVIVFKDGGTGAVERVPGAEHLSTLTLTRRVDAASSEIQRLFLAVTSGKVNQVRGTMTLAFHGLNKAPFLQYEFLRAFVSGIAASGNRHGGTAPEEQIQIAFDSVSLLIAHTV